VSDYMRAVPDQVAQFVPGEQGRFTSLGADGFGFSDTRAAARRFFRIDGPSVTVQALASLARSGDVDPGLALKAYEQYAIDDVTAGTTGNAGGDA